MITLRLGDGILDILPVVRGLSAGGDAVRNAFGNYDRYCVSLSPEEIEGVRHRETAEEYEPGELEIVLAHRLSDFGTVEVPAPAWCVAVDLCDEHSAEINALDMNDAIYTEIYCETVSPWEFVKEHRLAKKAMKKKFDMSSPENFMKEWDLFVNSSKGFREMALIRERHMFLRLREICGKGGRTLAVIDSERTENLIKLLENSHG